MHSLHEVSQLVTAVASIGPGAAVAAAVSLLARLEPAVDPSGELQEALWPLDTPPPAMSSEETFSAAIALIEVERDAQYG